MDVRYDFGGDEYIFVDFDIEMSLEVNFKILSICQEIERERIPGVIEVCPGNASYLMHYRPEEIDPEKLVKELRKLEHQADHITEPHHLHQHHEKRLARKTHHRLRRLPADQCADRDPPL